MDRDQAMSGRTMDEQIRFDRRGLVPAVVQDAATDEALMVAWMNREALRLTRETGQVHFWSRSREELWHKGATSGNFLNVREILADCDADTLLVRVDPEGPACHTGRRSCFFRTVTEDTIDAPAGASDAILEELFAVILDRKAKRPPGSYTVALFDAGEDEILKKGGGGGNGGRARGEGAGRRAIDLGVGRPDLPPPGPDGGTRAQVVQRGAGAGETPSPGRFIRSSASEPHPLGWGEKAGAGLRCPR